MPRPAGTSYIVLLVLLSLPFSPLTAASFAASQSTSNPSSHEGFGGIWVLNKNLGDASAPAPEAGREAGEGRRQGRRGGGGVAGGIGRGGGFGRYGGSQGAAREEDAAHRQAVMDFVRSLSDASNQLTIVVHENTVNITDTDGHVLALATNDKKVDERAENGLIKFTRKNHWDGPTLVSEIDVDNGPKIVRSYVLTPGGTQLEITTAVNGGPRNTKFSRFYERPMESH